MRTLEWRDLRKPAPLLALLTVSLVLVALLFRWWDSYVEDGLARWAVDEIAAQTDGTYSLTLGGLSFAPLSGSISFDSARVVTDTLRNRRRAEPLPVVRLRARGCLVSGLDLLSLLLGRSFDARVLGCRGVVTEIELVTGTQDDSRPADETATIAASLHQLARPLGLSSFHVARVSLPSLSLTIQRPAPRGGASLALERAWFDAEGIAFDTRVASAEQARLGATGLVLRPDPGTEVSVARLTADFTDSTLSLAGAEHEPEIPEDERVRRVRVRRDRIRFTLDSLEGRGVAYRAFLARGDIGIRVLELRGARLDVLTDRRIPKGPPKRHRTPQEVAAAADPALRLDSVLVRGGSILYREREPETERPGAVSFEQVRGTVLHLDLPSRGEPLRIEASARLMGEGRLTARATVPLDAPDFRYELSGRLGAMPAEAFNRFLSVNESFEVDGGRVEEITFSQTVRDGRARTTVTPRYRELSVEPTGDGGGVIGSVARGVKEFLAGAFVVRSSNPEDEGEDPLVSRTVRRYDPANTWLRFLWLGLRGALLEVVKE